MNLLKLALLPVCVRAFAWSAYDLGFHGLYPTQKYVSSDLLAPSPSITQWDPRCEDGNILITPRGWATSNPGPVMLDSRGNLIWMEYRFGRVMNFQVQRYKEQDYLTFWRALDTSARANGSYTLLDSSYEIAHEVSAVGVEMKGDVHEFQITANNTALVTIYHNREMDCTSLGLGPSCWISDSLFQEIDIETGRLIFQWQASDYARLSDTFKWPSGEDGKTEEKAFDFFHINSVDKDPLGNYYISSRFMHAILCISPSGEILWHLGGKNNNFTDLSAGEATNFSWQHHANWHANNTLSIFDNHGNNVLHPRGDYSRGLKVSLDLSAMTATLLASYVHPDAILAISQGSIQILPDSGNALVGFGNSPVYTEFSPEGDVLCDAHFGPALIFEILDIGLVKSYRAYKSHWVGRPKTNPAIKVKDGKAFVSWNGATEVRSWRLQGANEVGGGAEGEEGMEEFVTIQELERDGFETSFELDEISEASVRIAALDGEGAVMAYTAIVSASTSTSFSPWQVTFFILGLLSITYIFFRYKSRISRGAVWRRLRSSRIFALVSRCCTGRGDRQQLLESYHLLESQE